MRIGIIKETKVPEDNRVALSPQEIVDLQQKFPDVEFVVQKSDIRVYSDEEYALKGIRLVDHVDDCDVLFGPYISSIYYLICCQFEIYDSLIMSRFDASISPSNGSLEGIFL